MLAPCGRRHPLLSPPRDTSKSHGLSRLRRSAVARKRRAEKLFFKKKLARASDGGEAVDPLAPGSAAYTGAQGTQNQKPTTGGKLKYGAELKIATVNATGIGITERENTIRTIHKQHIEILALQETHVDNNSTQEKDKYTFIFSSNHIPKPTHKGKGKGQGQHKCSTWEAAGVGFLISKKSKTH